jgi:cytochrome o ubiquinol oxidase operon protein cyoD
MTNNTDAHPERRAEKPGNEAQSLFIGLGLAALLTAASFAIVATDLVWPPGRTAALLVLAVAQMGVHLVFFLHLSTAPRDINNVLALAFGLMIVVLVVGGTLWIMSHLNTNMGATDDLPKMQR